MAKELTTRLYDESFRLFRVELGIRGGKNGKLNKTPPKLVAGTVRSLKYRI